jgi:nicotinamide-nucleotide amidase
MVDRELIEQATALLDLCRKKKLKIAAAESCTGGLVAATLTEIAGSSDVFERGFVTYSNEAKQAMLGVPPEVLANHGAVSRETAQAMAKGALAHAPVDLAVSITGIAGPGGAVASRPVGARAFRRSLTPRPIAPSRAQIRRHRPRSRCAMPRPSGRFRCCVKWRRRKGPEQSSP